MFQSRILRMLFAARGCLALFLFCVLFATPAYAEWGIIDSLNLAPFIPMVLDALMSVATGVYEFFVGNGTGIIYIFIWGFLGISMGLYLTKMYFPKKFLGFFGIQGGGEMYEGKVKGFEIAENLLKPAMRAIIAATILLQIKPVYVTEFVVDPFLRFGGLYTESIMDSLDLPGGAKKIECPAEILDSGWISADGCNFLVQPVSDITHANNQIIKRGFEFINRGLLGLMTLIPSGGENFLNLVTGTLLVFTFVSSNFFMALLIINGIFKFGMSLILYPFKVLTYVAKTSNKEKWFDLWPAFDGIIKSLQQLIITMIACAFILAINIAIIKSLFQWNSSVFVVAAGGSAYSNVPVVAKSAMGFGQHSILWLSAILTFYLMFRIFELTKDKLKEYAGSGMTDLHDKVTKDAKTTWKNANDWRKKIGTAAGWIKKK